MSNIIVSQACRHAIVHNAEIADHKCIGQINHAKNRQLKTDISEGQKIAFNIDEIKIIGESMKKYVVDLCTQLLKKLNSDG